MSGRWLQDRRRDPYHRLAESEGMRSRAAYKLLQMSNRHTILSEGDVVLDLGCAPGGWLQASRKLVGPSGYILGIDVRPVIDLGIENVHVMTGDIKDPSISSRILERLPRQADAVLCDASPRFSGVGEVDCLRQLDLAERALQISMDVLRPGGAAVIKVMECEDLSNFRRFMAGLFDQVRPLKPQASRSRSSELYLYGRGFKGSRPSK
jgi:23S rRNA (uridine2552-2'-O)-methyltransferase